jgi:hypothetical protein
MTAPDSLRARFGLSDTRNGFHGSGAVPLFYFCSLRSRSPTSGGAAQATRQKRQPSWTCSSRLAMTSSDDDV